MKYSEDRGDRLENNYVAYHTHTDYSLLDSVTDYKDYVDLAVELGQKAISFSEHGKPLNWVSKKKYCEEKGIKYIHSVEIYLTENLAEKVRDNYHTILIAKNYEGVKELNAIVSKSTDEEHFYYVNRISFDEFLSLSDNIITTSACLASPLNKLPINHPMYKKLVQKYTFLEIQPHDNIEQKQFNVHLAQLSEKYHIPLIAATDAHSLNQYKAECREIMLKCKHKSYGNEDKYDLTYKSYDQLVEAFRKQDAIPERLWLQAIENTNVMADMVEDFELDLSFKYPILYGSAEEDAKRYREVIATKFKDKIERGIIPQEQVDGFKTALDEELRVFDKIGMAGFMLSMSELICWCKENGIPTGFARGSVAGSRAAYVSDIIDVNPEQWHTVFSRFCNEDRVEAGDIDTDLIESDRPKIFEYIINRFGIRKTARVASYGTNKDLGAIDDIGRALRFIWNENHNKKEDDNCSENPYNLKVIEKIKKDFETDPEKTKEKNKDIFYYFDGIVGTKVSQSVHPAGMIISPITLDDNYGTFEKDGMPCLMLDMEDAHTVGLVKYDFLVLGNIGIIKDTCDYIGIPYPKTNEINWNDQAVWKDMIKNTTGVFQMESAYATQLIRQFKPTSIEEMSLVTACIRPSGASYRDELLARKIHKNPSPMIDELLKANNGFLVYQEDQIKFLQEICGLSGSEADTIRRAIGKKDQDKINKALPRILNGYCSKSDKPREEAEKEAQEFLQILQDSASYSFGLNHSVAYCLLGYLCAYLRYYYPYEFITAYLNNAASQDDVNKGTELATQYGIRVTAPKFGASRDCFVFNKEEKIIYKGLNSIKYFNSKVGKELYDIAHEQKYERFTDVLFRLAKSSINQKQLDILIKIDFFDMFGNISECSRIHAMFEQLKRGEIKKIKRDGLGSTEEIVAKFGTCTNSKGQELKAYTITNAVGLIHALEDNIKSLSLKDITMQTKIQNQIELLGGTYLVTGKPEDRRKLLVEKITNLQKGDKVWGLSVETVSIGTGKRAKFTLREEKFILKPIYEGIIIYCDACYKNERGYWILSDYHKI